MGIITNVIFTESVDGHILEYLHHIYIRAKNHNDNFLFVVPKTFIDKKKLLTWDVSNNIKFIYLSDQETISCNSNNLLKKSFAITRTLLKYVKGNNAKRVFLINAIVSMPFLPIFLSSKIKLSGIFYKIYLYEDKKLFWRRMVDRIIYFLLTKVKCVDKLYILNDTKGVEILNKKYNTSRFVYLPDPIPYIDTSLLYNIRKEYKISPKDKVFLQFGSLDKRKNTIEILKAIDLMSEEELENKVFIFSGKLYPNIENEFYQLLEKLAIKAKIIYLKGFATYEMLNNLCYSADCILTLYSNIAQSSGTIGYAAFFNKPVIGPAQGLLGNLIVNNNLGYVIDKITPESIKRIFLEDIQPKQNNYKANHTVEEFCNQLFLSFN